MNLWQILSDLRKSVARATPIAGPGILTESTLLGTRIIAVPQGGGGAASAEEAEHPFKAWIRYDETTSAWQWAVCRLQPPETGTWDPAGRVLLFPFGVAESVAAVQWTAFDDTKTKVVLKYTADASTLTIVNLAVGDIPSEKYDDSGAKTLFYTEIATLAMAAGVLTATADLTGNLVGALPVWC